MATSFQHVQECLQSCAASVGYRGKVRGVPKEAAGNVRVAHFLRWLAENAVSSNSLSQVELDKFEEVKKTGRVLEGAELKDALEKVQGSEEKSTDELKSDISSLQQSVSDLKTQLQSLNSIQRILSDHHGSLVRERGSTSHTHTQSLTSYQSAMHTTQAVNNEVNSALVDLQSAVDDVTAFHLAPKEEDDGEERSEGRLLSHMSMGHYTSAEDHYLTELTAYTKKQFFQGIAVLAHAPSEEEAQSGIVDLDDPANVLMKGSSSEQYSIHCRELARLKALYPVVEAQRVSDILAEQYAVAVCRRAEEMETELRQNFPLDETLLRQHIREKQAHLALLHSQTQQLARQELPGLIQEMATLQVSTVLHGDYSLKMARQDYFTSKQDKVISYLLAQTSRQELLSMLYEVELRRHRDTHRLLSAATTQLHSWNDARNKRTQAMQSSSLLPVKETRQTIDSRDQFASRMCSILGVSASGSASLLHHSSLERAVDQLVQQRASLEALLSALENEQQQTVQEATTMSRLLGKQVFGPSGNGCPQLTVMEYEQECSKLEIILSTMEQNIKKLLSDFDAKKKCLQGNQLIERERRLFVHFFTDPQQMTRELAELAKRVEILATAKQTSSN